MTAGNNSLPTTLVSQLLFTLTRLGKRLTIIYSVTHYLFLTLIFLFSFRSIFPTAIFAYEVPPYKGLVNDYASTLNSTEKEQLETKLNRLASQPNGLEIALVTITNLGDESIEDVALQFFDIWQIGKTSLDNGILILLVLDKQQVRIQTGYGTESYLNDAKIGRIIREQMVPQLQQSHFWEAYNLAIDEIVNNYQTPPPDPIKVPLIDQLINLGPWPFLFFGTLLTYFISFMGRNKTWWAGGVLGAVIGYLINTFVGAVILAIIGLILDYILSKNYRQWHLEHRSNSWRKTFGGFYSPGKSGFKFGGGRTGGGGATGRW